MPRRHFRSKRISNSIVVPAGTSTVSIPIYFVPDFIRVKFQDTPTGAAPNTLNYSLNTAPDAYNERAYSEPTFTPYNLEISWTTSEVRTIRYVIAQLPTDSEQTIAFNFN